MTPLSLNTSPTASTSPTISTQRPENGEPITPTRITETETGHPPTSSDSSLKFSPEQVAKATQIAIAATAITDASTGDKTDLYKIAMGLIATGQLLGLSEKFIENEDLQAIISKTGPAISTIGSSALFTNLIKTENFHLLAAPINFGGSGALKMIQAYQKETAPNIKSAIPILATIGLAVYGTNKALQQDIPVASLAILSIIGTATLAYMDAKTRWENQTVNNQEDVSTSSEATI